jgi:hypothetical protein
VVSPRGRKREFSRCRRISTERIVLRRSNHDTHTHTHTRGEAGGLHTTPPLVFSGPSKKKKKSNKKERKEIEAEGSPTTNAGA